MTEAFLLAVKISIVRAKQTLSHMARVLHPFQQDYVPSAAAEPAITS